MRYIAPGTGMEIVSCLDYESYADIARAFSLYKQNKINGIIVLGGSHHNRQIINRLLRQGMTLNENLFHLKKFRRKR